MKPFTVFMLCWTSAFGIVAFFGAIEGRPIAWIAFTIQAVMFAIYLRIAVIENRERKERQDLIADLMRCNQENQTAIRAYQKLVIELSAKDTP